MLKTRVSALLLLALALGGVMVVRDRTERGAADEMENVPPTSVAPAVEAIASGRVVHFWTEPDGARPQAVTVAQAAAPLGADASALVAEQVALQLLAKDCDLELSPRQWAALAAATAHLQAVRQAYEASLASVTRRDRGAYRLEIPAYPEAGDALRAQLHAAVREQLGPHSAEEVLARLGSALEGHFAGFGVSVQTLEFTAAAGASENDYQVTRTLHYWNSVEGSDRLTTRRETHFPGLEDPSGHTWGPFLSVLAASTAGAAGAVGG
jgi:hypothetical protein